ncbi:hypothetical protein [uncultured Eudoraea sp.]|uniref:hypothetical protein n=1 Tax=uncultured Eudoraea sp. TaxID=1035614 RepID=UPI00262C83F3|nr:hypothetical protein [uncultured Eudoraea sp.]
MPHILKNNKLEIHIDLPFENYNFSRFDWTGKIAKVKFQNVLVSGIERTDALNEHHFGKGFYNEFGIDAPLGFEETNTGDWFHKIGVGLLKKDDSPYLFSKNYEIKPAEFNTIPESNRISISCKSEAINGFSYVLRKLISLHESSFSVKYHLENTGEKDIATNEYSHNFIAINNELIGEKYTLKFPFTLKSELFEESVNPGQNVVIRQKEITFKRTPEEQFFFSNLSGGESVRAAWELMNFDSKIGIRETTDFQTNKVNLWGWKHVVSPELFFRIFIKPGQSIEWTRIYNTYKW